MTVGFLVQEEAGKGLLLALLGVLPQNLCYIPALLGAGVLSLYFLLHCCALSGMLPCGVLVFIHLFSLFYPAGSAGFMGGNLFGA